MRVACYFDTAISRPMPEYYQFSKGSRKSMETSATFSCFSRGLDSTGSGKGPVAGFSVSPWAP